MLIGSEYLLKKVLLQLFAKYWTIRHRSKSERFLKGSDLSDWYEIHRSSKGLLKKSSISFLENIREYLEFRLTDMSDKTLNDFWRVLIRLVGRKYIMQSVWLGSGGPLRSSQWKLYKQNFWTLESGSSVWYLKY